MEDLRKDYGGSEPSHYYGEAKEWKSNHPQHPSYSYIENSYSTEDEADRNSSGEDLHLMHGKHREPNEEVDYYLNFQSESILKEEQGAMGKENFATEYSVVSNTQPSSLNSQFGQAQDIGAARRPSIKSLNVISHPQQPTLIGSTQTSSSSSSSTANKQAYLVQHPNYQDLLYSVQQQNPVSSYLLSAAAATTQPQPQTTSTFPFSQYIQQRQLLHQQQQQLLAAQDPYYRFSPYARSSTPIGPSTHPTLPQQPNTLGYNPYTNYQQILAQGYPYNPYLFSGDSASIIPTSYATLQAQANNINNNNITTTNNTNNNSNSTSNQTQIQTTNATSTNSANNSSSAQPIVNPNDMINMINLNPTIMHPQNFPVNSAESTSSINIALFQSSPSSYAQALNQKYMQEEYTNQIERRASAPSLMQNSPSTYAQKLYNFQQQYRSQLQYEQLSLEHHLMARRASAPSQIISSVVSSSSTLTQAKSIIESKETTTTLSSISHNSNNNSNHNNSNTDTTMTIAPATNNSNNNNNSSSTAITTIKPTQRNSVDMIEYDPEEYFDVTPYIFISQEEAAKKLGIPSSTLSKRWREATMNRKWPYRQLGKIDREIKTLMHNISPGEDVNQEMQANLALLLRQRQEEARVVYIKKNPATKLPNSSPPSSTTNGSSCNTNGIVKTTKTT